MDRWYLKANREAGFQSRQFVREAYAIVEYVNGEVFLQEDGVEVVREYAPIAHQNLPEEFAHIPVGNEQGLLQFAERYGLLGYTRFVSDEERGTRLWLPYGSEPLSWIWVHVEMVQRCLEIMHMLHAEEDDALAAYLRPWRQEDVDLPALREEMQGLLPEDIEDIVVMQFPRVARQGSVQQPSEYIFAYDATWHEIGAGFCTSVINHNITGVRRVLDLDDHGVFTSNFAASTLIEHIYWHLADQLVEGRIRRCAAKGCHALFVQRHQQQHYCPPPEGKAESPCAKRERMRKYREKSR